MCREEFPHLQKLYTQLKPKGLEIVAVNTGDDAETVNSYVRENGWSFPIVRDEADVAEQYRVQGYPTNYVLDGKGRIVWRGTGFDAEAIRTALARLGVQ